MTDADKELIALMLEKEEAIDRALELLEKKKAQTTIKIKAND